MDFENFQKRYGSEEDCVKQLFQSRWPEGFRCPRCSHGSCFSISTRRLPLFECKSCRSQTSLIAGTIMEGSRTPLRLWFYAIYLHSRQQGINALQLSRTLDVTYKTAWLICHKIRKAMSLKDCEQLLGGNITVSDAIYARRIVPSFAWHEQEQPILIGAEIDITYIKKIKFAHCGKHDLKNRYDAPSADSFIRKSVSRDSANRVRLIRRFGDQSNRKLLQLCQEAFLWLAWTFRGIGPKHLQVYLDHFAYMWNRSLQPLRLFGDLLTACATKPAITYPVLTGSEQTRSRSSRRSRSSSLVTSIAG